jgi:hypothetical protein
MQSRLPKKRTGAKPRRDENVARAYGKLQLEANQELNKKKPGAKDPQSKAS